MRKATIHLSNEELASFGMREFIGAFRDAGVRDVSELQCQRPGCLLAITVADPVPDERLSSLADVEWWERLDGDDEVRYLCKVAVPAFEKGFDPYHDTEVSQERLDVTGDGLDVTIVGNHDDLSDRVQEYDDAGAQVLLQTLTDYDGPADPLDAMTQRQTDVLETAFDMGYFDVPRDATSEEVAASLDVDPSTVREHLQRAQHNLLSDLLEG
jgi:hypothetical protein